MGKYGIGRVATTIALSEDGEIVVTYHQTHVVTYNDDYIKLDSGGYSTVTTKRRMNEVAQTMGLGFRVHQTDWDWFVVWNGKTYPFSDEITLWRKSGDVTLYSAQGLHDVQPIPDK